MMLSPEELDNLRSYKRMLFDLYWEKFGVFYLQAMPHPNLEIGKRGLLGDEVEEGIVLVFGDKAVRGLDSQKEYLFAELQFGSRWEEAIIPWDSVSRYFDKSQYSLTQVKYISDFELPPSSKQGHNSNLKSVPMDNTGGKVIKVDFGGKGSK